jgi:hypothetical protein
VEGGKTQHPTGNPFDAAFDGAKVKMAPPPALAGFLARHEQNMQISDPVIQGGNPLTDIPLEDFPVALQAPEPEGGDVLPIDAHRDEILAHIAKHRVTVIQGETGCGKSSRLPQMLLEDGGPMVRMMVAQPRRIAAHSLLQRARSCLGKSPQEQGLVGMRMGHGVKDETPYTRLWYGLIHPRNRVDMSVTVSLV